jgi:riboflavin-specific deaminase-like protein
MSGAASNLPSRAGEDINLGYVRTPYTVLSCAISADGCLDDASPDRLVLSGQQDWDRVDEVRAGVDAILVGAGTVRADNPRLLIRSAARQVARTGRGLPPHPLRVTLTASGDLDPDANIFTGPGGPALVYCPASAAARLAARLGERAVVAGVDDPLSLRTVLTDLSERNVARLMIEGGSRVLAEALQSDLANELRLAVAPFLVGDPAAPRFAAPVAAAGVAYPQSQANPMTLVSAGRVGSVTVSRYLLGPGGPDQRFLAWAVELSRMCPPSQTAFSVGAVIVSADGQVLSTGYSREETSLDHAEEVALRKLGSASPAPGVPAASLDPRLCGATVYSSLVPCGARASRPVTCVQHIVQAGIGRVVYAWREPPLFADGDGAQQLSAAGVEVVELPALAPRAVGLNAHLPLR